MLVSALLHWVVQLFGWDTLEPYTWILGVALFVAAPLVAHYSPDKFSPRAVEANYVKHQTRRSYVKFGFNHERFTELSARAEQARAEA